MQRRTKLKQLKKENRELQIKLEQKERTIDHYIALLQKMKSEWNLDRLNYINNSDRKRML